MNHLWSLRAHDERRFLNGIMTNGDDQICAINGLVHVTFPFSAAVPMKRYDPEKTAPLPIWVLKSESACAGRNRASASRGLLAAAPNMTEAGNLDSRIMAAARYPVPPDALPASRSDAAARLRSGLLLLRRCLRVIRDEPGRVAPDGLPGTLRAR